LGAQRRAHVTEDPVAPAVRTQEWGWDRRSGPKVLGGGGEVADTRLATIATMSMYSELLAMSLGVADGEVEAGASSEKHLLDELAECRNRLEADAGSTAPRRPDAPSRIATELQYDRALIRLCRMHAIACDVAAFTRPHSERRRLEEALDSAGVEFRARPRADWRRSPIAGVYEPPAGS